MIKHFQSSGSGSAATRYSPGSITSVEKRVICGDVPVSQIGTSRMERFNLTTRMQVRRFTRLTNAHSKKTRSHDAMLGLYFAWYNFCRNHSTIKTTPAVKAGLADAKWSMEQLLTVPLPREFGIETELPQRYAGACSLPKDEGPSQKESAMRLSVWMLCLFGSLAITTAGKAQPGNGMANLRSNIFIVAGNAAVQEELGLSENEIAAVSKVVDEYNNAYREALNSSGIKLGVLSPAEREKLRLIRKEAIDKFTPNLKAVLMAKRFTRMQQINYQALRAHALLEPEVIKELAVTADQQEAIRAIAAEYQMKVNEQARVGDETVPEKVEQINSERDAIAIELLTIDQQKKFAALIGNGFDITQLNIRNYVPITRGGGGRIHRDGRKALK